MYYTHLDDHNQPRTQGTFRNEVLLWILVMWFRFIAQILGNKTIHFEGRARKPAYNIRTYLYCT